MKKLVSLIVAFAMICTLCPAIPLSPIMTASAANQTYYYGFEDGKLPSVFSLTQCASTTYTNGIFSFVPSKVSASNAADPQITITQSFSGDEVNQLKIRMKHDLVQRTDGVGSFVQVYINSTDADGNTYTYNEGRTVKTSTELKSDGFVTYTVDFRNAKHWAGCTINNIRLDPVNSNVVDGTTIEIDYIMLCKYADELDSIISYEFETDDDYEGIVPKLKSKENYTGFSVADGCINYQYTTEVDTQLVLPAIEIKPDVYEYAEIIMKHDLTAASDIRMYIAGTFGDGTELKWNENNAIKPAIAQTSNGEFRRYVLTLDKTSGGKSLSGAVINSIRVDPVNTQGTYSIDSIRFVPHYVRYEPLDEESTTLTYTFANNDAGCAKGTMKIDFGEQNPLFAKSVELIWASGNATDGYTALEDYTSITTTTGSVMSKGYVISRPMYIPEGMTALIARVTDVEKTFDLVADIPSGKVLEKTEPKFVAALTSDFHFGDSSVAKTTPAQKYYDLQSHVQANADTMLVSGDIVQWYGVKSMDEYYYLEYLASGGTNYTAYADYDPATEVNQWDMAMEYFQTWEIPVYVVEGNHETPTADRLKKGHTGKYMKEWMTEWLNFAVNSGMYDAPVEREKYIYDNTYEYVTYYDDYVTGDDGTKYHIITMRNFHMGNNKLTDQELDWLDKKLYESEATGTPTFLMIHVPLKGTVIPDGTKHANDFTDAGFKAVVDKHPDTVIVSGHTHYSLYGDWQWTINGAGDAPSWINDGAVVDTALYDPATNTNTSGNNANCELVYAEVYEDRIVTRAYDVIKQKYIGTSINQITLKPETSIGDISVTKAVADGNVTLAADCATEGVTYQWYVGGEEAGTGASVTLPDTCTDFVAVRVTDASGSFRSESFDSIYDADIIYDEGRTYHLSISDEDGYNYFTAFQGPTTHEWVNGVAGKTDNVFHMAYNNETTASKRVYATAPVWAQKNENSKYLVLKFNAMPLNSDTIVYVGVNQSVALTPRVRMTANEWTNVTVVWDIENKQATQYINGELYKTTTCERFMSNSDAAKNGILRLCIATINDNTSVNSLDAYIDDFEVYETVNAPVIAPIVDMERTEINGTNVYSADNKLAYVPAGTTAGNMSKAFWCAVVDANGATKASSAAVTDTDMLMYFDPISGSYNYYSVKTYTDYSSLFVSGADNGIFTASDVRLYVSAKTAGDTVVIAQYDSGDDLITAQYKVCDAAGLNEITFTKAADTAYASVFVWDDIDTIKPLTEKTDIFVK